MGMNGQSWYGNPGESTRSHETELAHEMTSHLERAFWMLDRKYSLNSEVAWFADFCSTSAGRRLFVAALLPMISQCLATAWRLGWQPVDLHRLVGKRLKTGPQTLAGDLIAFQLGEYAAALVPGSWWDQLSDLEIRVWWPPSKTVLEARADKTHDWSMMIGEVIPVLHLLRALPRIEQLTPLPGQVQTPDPAGPVQIDVDQRMLGRVRQLLAQAASTTFETEAETFTEAAQALMARHRIDEALLAAHLREHADSRQSPTKAGVRAQRIGIENPYEMPKAMLLQSIATANRCRAVWSKEFGFSTIIGHATDVAGVEVLFTSLLLQATKALAAAGPRRGRPGNRTGGSRTRSFRAAFLSSYATRIGERLNQVAAEEEETAATRASAAGTALLPVLAARSDEVNEFTAELFPDVRSHEMQQVTDREGWMSGRVAADQARLGVDTALDPSG